MAVVKLAKTESIIPDAAFSIMCQHQVENKIAKHIFSVYFVNTVEIVTLSTQFKAIICFDAVSLTDDRQSACQEIIALGKLQNSQVGINTNATNIRQYF